MANLSLKSLRMTLAGLVLAVALALPAAVAGEAQQRVNTDGDRVAIRGYDPVAYFTMTRPVKGRPEFEHVWQDARWRFANAEHRDMFAREPDRYSPRYGGFCTGGMALGRLAPIDPEAWAIIDGRLYLNYSKEGRDRLVENPAPTIAKAEDNWTELGRPE